MSRHCYFLFVMQLVRAELVAVQLDLARTAVDRTNLIQSSIVSYERGRWMRRATAGIVNRVVNGRPAGCNCARRVAVITYHRTLLRHRMMRAFRHRTSRPLSCIDVVAGACVCPCRACGLPGLRLLASALGASASREPYPHFLRQPEFAHGAATLMSLMVRRRNRWNIPYTMYWCVLTSVSGGVMWCAAAGGCRRPVVHTCIQRRPCGVRGFSCGGGAVTCRRR